ncbi:MAG: M20/M25/M40 family metallo-hydrolase [Pyrinomonadaceae bacterium]|nr:M20/M25/M40 family metallo-hydrolase [Pyrinomonadaceae bacterium]
MLRRKLTVVILLSALLIPSFAYGQNVYTAPPEVIAKIKDEGMNRSQVMQTLSYLTDVIGARLTGSPALLNANNWTKDTLAKWGLQNAHTEAWGPFGRGWTLKSFNAEVTAPYNIPLIAYPKAWSPSKSAANADVVYLDVKTDADFDKYKGQLKDKIVLISDVRETKADFDGMGRRFTDEELAKMEAATPPTPGGQGQGQRPQGQAPQNFQQLQQVAAKRFQFLLDEGAAVVVDSSRTGSGGTVFVQGATVVQPPQVQGAPPTRLSPQQKEADGKILPQITVATEHYNRIIRMLQQGTKLKMSVNIQSEYNDKDPMAYNTVAEIPGSDPKLKEELVMLGGHMDSWHAGTGATDNAAGVSVAMEAVRIIQALGLKPRRTIRIALWSGEEQGLLGSRAYVKQHLGEMKGAGNQFGPRDPNAPKPELVKGAEYDKFSSYFNLDNGTGKVRGVYLQGNEAVRPIFKAWLAPFNDMGAKTLTISNTGGTDHLSYDGIGLPGFQFIQDTIEYDTRTHHSNQDVYDRLQADDMKQASTIMAAFVYQAAMMDEKMPRKPMP